MLGTVDRPPASTELVDALFREREAKGVMAAMIARLAYLALGALSLPSTSTGNGDLLRTLALIAVGFGVTGVAYRWAQRRQHILRAGMLGVAFDSVAIWLLPMSWYAAVGGYDAVPLAMIAKTDIAFICIVLIAINALTLRPLYPLVVAGAGAILQIVLLVVAVNDPRTALTSDPVVAHLGPAVHPVFAIWQIITTMVVGLIAALIALVSRRMVADAAQAEGERIEVLAREAERVADAKLSSLTRLVAGIAHEINTPAGALSSGASVAQKAIDRLRFRLDDVAQADPQLARLLSALERSSTVATEAAERLTHIVTALKNFAHLDQGEWQVVDLTRALESTLALVPADLRGDTVVRFESAALPPVRGRAREIGQVFMTVIENAFEANAGRGELTIETLAMDDDVTVIVQDSGPGIRPEVRARLFDLEFRPKQGRMGMGLGLPVGRRIVRQHGGDITVESDPGAGTRVFIRLPMDASARNAEPAAP